MTSPAHLASPQAHATPGTRRVDPAAGLGTGTKVATPHGWVTVDEISVGTLVLARDGRAYPVQVVTDLPIDGQTPSMVISFASGSEIESGPHQTWPCYSTEDRQRYRRASVGDRLRWQGEAARHRTLVREARLAMPSGLEATAPGLLQTLRRSGVNRWRDLAQFRSTISMHVPTVEGDALRDPGAFWSVAEVFRFIEGRLARDADAPYGQVLAACEMIDAPAPGYWALPLTEGLDLPRRNLDGAPRLIGTEIVLSGQQVPSALLRGSHPQRRELLAGMVDASGLGDGLLLAMSESQLHGFTELIASVGAPYRVTWVHKPEDGQVPHYRVAFVYPPPTTPFVPVESVRLAPSQPRRIISAGSPDGTVLTSGLVAAHAR